MCTSEADADVTVKESGPWSLRLPPKLSGCLPSGHRVLSHTLCTRHCLLTHLSLPVQEEDLETSFRKRARRSNSKLLLLLEGHCFPRATQCMWDKHYNFPFLSPLSALKCKCMHPGFQSRLPWRPNSTVYLMTLL